MKKQFDEMEGEIVKLRKKGLFNSIKYQIKQFSLSLIGKEEKGLRRSGFEDFIEGKNKMKETKWFNSYFYEQSKELHSKEVPYILKHIDAISVVKNA